MPFLKFLQNVIFWTNKPLNGHTTKMIPEKIRTNLGNPFTVIWTDYGLNTLSMIWRSTTITEAFKQQ